MVHKRVTVALVFLVAAAGCAHGGFRAPEDPVEEARLRLGEILSAEGDVACAAERVEGDRGMAALLSLGASGGDSWEPRTPSMHRWRSYQAQQMNLSQASAQLAQAEANYQTAQANAFNGVPNAQRLGEYAMWSFDALYAGITTTGPSGLRRKDGKTRGGSVSGAQYATVWTQYFSTDLEDTARDEVLDWLTTRSLANLDELRTYHEEFARALKRCG